MKANPEYGFYLPILTYHSLDNSGSVISVPPQKFRKQMQFLLDSSFKVISLRELTTYMRKNLPFPKKTAVITFDDGFRNVYFEAYPILKEFGFTATVFLVTGYCGRTNQWEGQSEKIPDLELLQWEEIKEMSENSLDFGAHTVTHPDLTELAPEQAAREIIDSKTMIQEQLGKKILFFAYPYGRQNTEVKSMVKDEFSGACSTELDFVNSKSDLYSLPRIEMYYFSQNNFFTSLENPFFYYYLKLRAIPRSFKLKSQL